MAFNGSPVVKQVGDHLVRITGISLLADQSGTIALFESLVAPGVRLPAAFKPRGYDYPDGAPPVTIPDAVQVYFNHNGAAADNSTPILVAKSGTKPDDFLITMTNTDAGEGANSGPLEIYVRHH